MAIWKDSKSPSPSESREPARFDLPESSELAGPAAGPAPVAPLRTERAGKESLIASDLTIEGKIEGSGSVRIAGRFKGDIDVRGDLTIEPGAKLTGGVRADKVVISGELEGNIEAASRVELQQGGVLIGDLKAASLTVAAGSRMRGQADFGGEDGKAASRPVRAGAGSNGNGSEGGGTP